MPLQIDGNTLRFTNLSRPVNDLRDGIIFTNHQVIESNAPEQLGENLLLGYVTDDGNQIELTIHHYSHLLNNQKTYIHILTIRQVNQVFDSVLNHELKQVANQDQTDPSFKQSIANISRNIPASNFTKKSLPPRNHSNIIKNNNSNLSRIVNKYQQHHYTLITNNQQFRLIIANIPMFILVTDENGIFSLCEGKNLAQINLQPGELVGYSIFDIYADQPTIINSVQRCLAGEYHALSHEWYGSYFEMEYIPFVIDQDKKNGALIIGIDVTEQYQYAESARLQNWRSVIFSNIAVKIHQSLDMNEILQTTVREIRNFLRTDRVLIYRFNSDWSGDVVVESVDENWSSTLGLNIIDTCFIEGMWQDYQNGKHVAIDDICNSNLSPCHRKLLENLEVKSNLVVPIIENEKLWGLLIAHHCSEPRYWKKIELELLIQLATQLSIALYQAHLLNQETSQRKLLAQQNIELDLARHEAETATTMKSTFLAMMSHEIRTPMNAVLGMTGLLMDTELNAEQLDFVRTIRFSGETLLSIINEILDFSKLEAQEMKLEFLNFNLMTCIEDCTDLLTNIAHHKGIDLYSWIDVNLPNELRGDVTRLKQIMINLINNAIKFTKQGEVIIQASLIEENDDQVLIRISVKDTGIGIAKEKISKLFTPFTQGDASTTRKYGGTGLGLAISKQLVDLMGGKIGVISEEGNGSEFWIELPLIKCESVAANLISSSDLHHLINCRVLVIDHHSTNCKLINYQLSSYQMHVDTCQDSSTGWDLLISADDLGKPYQIIILDLKIEDINEASLVQQIKSHPNLKNTHLVMLTSWQQRGITQKYKEIGGAAFLNKPVKQSILVECLAEIMSSGNYNPEIKLRGISHQQNEQNNSQKIQFIRKTSKLKILLVEDSPINQKVIINQLSNLGYTADVAGNGIEALDLLDQISYDMVLMDCQMPELDGYDTTRAIRQLKAPKCDVVIIAMTANAMQEDRQRCLDAGMNDYLSKPISKESLNNKITTWEKQLIEPVNPSSTNRFSKISTNDRFNTAINIKATKSAIHSSSNNSLTSMSVSDSISQYPQNFNRAKIEQDLGIVAVDLGILPVAKLNLNLPLIDWDYLHTISGNDLEFEKDLLQTFVESVPDILDALTLAIESADILQIIAQAHLLKGSSASTGIQFIAQLAAAIESAGKKIRVRHPNNASLLDIDNVDQTNLQIQTSFYFQITTDYISEIRQNLILLNEAISS
ncbi:MAG: response regulator [Pseudanabaena sp. ELA607]